MLFCESPVVDEMEPRWDHLDPFELRSYRPAVVINAKLCPFGDIQQNQCRSLVEQLLCQILVHG